MHEPSSIVPPPAQARETGRVARTPVSVTPVARRRPRHSLGPMGGRRDRSMGFMRTVAYSGLPQRCQAVRSRRTSSCSKALPTAVRPTPMKASSQISKLVFARCDVAACVAV
eukprot:289141-Prymnesium_polylepis.1